MPLWYFPSIRLGLFLIFKRTVFYDTPQALWFCLLCQYNLLIWLGQSRKAFPHPGGHTVYVYRCSIKGQNLYLYASVEIEILLFLWDLVVGWRLLALYSDVYVCVTYSLQFTVLIKSSCSALKSASFFLNEASVLYLRRVWSDKTCSFKSLFWIVGSRCSVFSCA